MDSLIKIKEVSNHYDVTARTLRYYEDMGLISSTRSDDYAYRMYDEEAVRRLEQILILRKLNISIRDIQRIFSAPGSEVVLEVLGKKVQHIDDEVALLHDLKAIVLDFIREIERMDFTANADIKLLYDKAKEIETQIINVDYSGKSADWLQLNRLKSQSNDTSPVNRMMEITAKLDKQIPDVMIVRIPKFRAVSSGYKSFEEVFGLMSWAWQENHTHFFKKVIFNCADFLKRRNDQFEYLMAIEDSVTEADTAPYEIIEFEGGLYALAVSIDGDDESIHKVEEKIARWIENTNFEYDENRDIMGHMAYCDEEIKKGLGYEQLQRYVPIKLKEFV